MRNITIKLTFLCFYILLLFNFLIFTACSTKFECKNFEKDLALLNTTDTIQRFNFINSVIAKNNKCINAFLARADLYSSKNNLIEAKEDYKIVLQNDRNNAYALYQLGVLYQVEDKLDSSLLYLDKALSQKRTGDIIIDNNINSNNLILPSDRYDIESSEIIYQMGISYYHKREINNALGSFDYCIRNEYNIANSYLYKGAIYYESNKLDSACSSFRVAKLKGSEFASEYLNKYCK